MHRFAVTISIATALAVAIIATSGVTLAAGGGANCTSVGTLVIHAGTDGSQCQAEADTGSKAIANSTLNSGTFATAMNSSSAAATASNGSIANALALQASKAKSTAKNGGEAGTAARNGGQAVASATGLGSHADAATQAHCVATAKSKGMGSTESECFTNGGFVKTCATGDGQAFGTDNGPPTCIPGSGTVSVVS